MSAAAPSETPRLTSHGLTDIGKKRRTNQDAIYLSEDGSVFVLSDGMGGHLGGEQASRLATETASAVFADPEGEWMFSTSDQTELLKIKDAAARITRMAILMADQTIVKTSRERLELSGMGSTIETLLIRDGRVTVGHVGDSRVYRMRSGILEQITEDHSLLNEELKRRPMTDDEIAIFPYKNRLVRALGHLSDRRVDIFQDQIERGDVFLMCSDGLTDVASDTEILNILSRRRNEPGKACKRFVEVANAGGGPDNISVIVVSAV